MRHSTIRTIACSTVVACLLAASGGERGHAAEPEPVVGVRGLERPTTLPQGYLRSDVATSLADAPTGLATRSTAGIGMGLTDVLQLDAVLTVLETHPTLGFGQPVLSGSYGWDVSNTVALLPTVGVTFPVRVDHAWTTFVSVTATWTATSSFEVGFAPAFETTIDGDPEMVTALPIIFVGQFTDRLFGEVSTGVVFTSPESGGAPDFTAPAVPVSAGPGISLGRTGGLVHDVTASFEWPALLSSAPSEPSGPDLWVASLTWNAHFPIFRSL